MILKDFTNIEENLKGMNEEIELIRKDIIELKQKQSDDRLDLLTKTVQELKEKLESVLK